ncbi:MAG: hypothetical protein IKH54_05075 [Bacilli bacterium]|nr:hypothetical protein [Bacilli bacterium]
MQESIEKSSYHKLVRFIPLDWNRGSKIYKDGKHLIKIPMYSDKEEVQEKALKELEEALLYIDKKKIKGVVEVTNLFKENSKTVGYRLVRYKDFKSLHKFKNRSINLKVQDCKKIMEIFSSFNDYNLRYHDFHPGNILLNDKTNELLVCDLDSCEINNDTEEKNKQLKSALGLCVQYIYNMYPNDAELILTRSTINVDKNNCIKEIYDSIGKSNFKESINKLDNIDKRYILSDKFRMKEEIKDFVRRGYYH